MSVTAALISAPAGNTALPWLVLTETSSATVLPSEVLGDSYSANSAVTVMALSSTTNTTAKFAVYMGNATAAQTAPVKTGTYVVKLTPATGAGGGSGVLAGSTAQTLTITVTADAKLDTVVTAATVILNKGETSSATSDATVTHAKEIGTSAATTAAAAARISTACRARPRRDPCRPTASASCSAQQYRLPSSTACPRRGPRRLIQQLHLWLSCARYALCAAP
jgi:hypothetical protein